MESEQIQALRWAFRENHFILRVHGFVEMKLEGLSVDDLSMAGSNSEVLEEYPERSEGYPLAVVTIYEPEPPSWRDERTRG